MLGLTITRKKGESVVIDNEIVITVVEIRSDKVRFGVVKGSAGFEA